MKIIHHFDSDGKAAAYVVNKLTTEKDEFGKEYFSINYGIAFPFEKINKGEIVYIVDYSISSQEMDRLLSITPNVIWIDHHITAINKYKGYDKPIRGLRYDGIAGCMLTYNYLTQIKQGKREDEILYSPLTCESAPEFLKLIADYDVWEFKYGARTKGFEKGLSLYPNNPDDNLWDILWEEPTKFMEKIIQQGLTVIKYRENLMQNICKYKGFATVFDGYKAWAVNCPSMTSADYYHPDDEEYDIYISFSYNGKEWVYSLRSCNGVDVAAIAAKHGGGGHKAAAGFSSKKMLL